MNTTKEQNTEAGESKHTSASMNLARKLLAADFYESERAMMESYAVRLIDQHTANVHADLAASDKARIEALEAALRNLLGSIEPYMIESDQMAHRVGVAESLLSTKP